jgi:DNA-binding response OmpR family regulator
MKKILIVEDDPIITRIWQMMIQRQGFAVEVASNGEVAIEILKELRPHLVLLDLMMPKVNGLGVLKFLRAQEALRRVPVLVITNATQPEMLAEAMAAGATECLSKLEFTTEQIFEKLFPYLSRVEEWEAPAAAPLPAAAGGIPPAGPAGLGGVGREARKMFLRELPAVCTNLRNTLQAFSRSPEAGRRLDPLLALNQAVHSVASSAWLAGFTRIAHLAGALESLLRELYEEPDKINPSTLRTVALAVDFLVSLLHQAPTATLDMLPPALTLILDDDSVSRWAASAALELVNLRPICLDDSELALSVLRQNRFDLVILDVNMPGKNGFEVCEVLRASTQNKKTPVLFVTGLNDFEVRARSTLSGGNDFIAKPFLLIELAVKALLYVLQSQAGEAAR